MKKLNHKNLKSRRRFLKQAAGKSLLPAVVVYSIQKSAPPVFAREPI